MPGSPSDQPARRAEDAQSEPIRYPENHIVGVLDTVEEVNAAANALIDGGFLDSEIDVECGETAGERLNAVTGRGGLSGLAMRIAKKIGLENVEMEIKTHYAEALRDGKFLLRVAIPTDDRKAHASQILAKHGASAIHYFGRFTIETLAPPNAA